MTEPNLDVSVVICAFTEDRWDDLVAAVESVQRQSVPPREIIVVIDHNPALLERVYKHLPGVVAIENRGVPGASDSRNSGGAVALGALIAFLDDDSVAEVDWLERLSPGYEDPRVLGVGGAIELSWLSSRPAWLPKEFYWAIGGTYRGMPETVAPIRNLWSGNMSIRREVFEAMGGFRSDFGKVKTQSRPEDTELCIQALQRWPQHQWLYDPRVRVRHTVPVSRARWRYFLSRCYAEGRGKAELSKLVGIAYGLSSERRYVFTILPRGVICGVVDTLLGRGSAGIQRAGAIIAGLVATATGYLIGVVSGWSEQGKESRQTMMARQNSVLPTER